LQNSIRKVFYQTEMGLNVGDFIFEKKTLPVFYKDLTYKIFVDFIVHQ